MTVLTSLLDASGIGEAQAAMLAFFLLFLPPFVYFVWRARIDPHLPLRRIAAFDSLRDLLARAAETGRPVHISMGTGGFGGTTTADTLAGLNTLEFLTERAAVSDIPPIVSVTEPTALPVAQDQMRRIYERQGYPEDFDPLQARFIAPPVNGSAVPYAAGVMDVLGHEDVIANVMVGSFGDEFLLMAERGAQLDVFQAGGSSNPSVLPFVYTSVSQPLFGEEIYAAGAYLSNRASHIASLVTQDVMRVFFVILVVLAVLARTLGLF
jgi:Domain of unknown function (DUF6754)